MNSEYVLLTQCSVPTELTIWDWLFDSPHSVLAKNPNSLIRGYTNAVTNERIDYRQVKEHTTHLSTALVKKYGLKQGEAVALFSPNTIWYPVAMLGTLRAGLPPWIWKDTGHMADASSKSRRGGVRCLSGVQCRGDDICS